MSFEQGGTSRLAPGDTVAVEYMLHRPWVGRIVGMRFFEHTWGTAWIFILPMIALALAAPRLCAAPGQLRLLRDGQVAHASLTEKRGGGTGGRAPMGATHAPAAHARGLPTLHRPRGPMHGDRCARRREWHHSPLL